MITTYYLRVSDAEELAFCIEHSQPFDARAKKIIRELAQVIPEGKVTTKPTLLGRVVQLGTREAMVTSKSSSRVSVLADCGINVERYEILNRVAVPKGADKCAFAESLCDELTQQVYDQRVKTFSREVEIPKVQIVPVMKKGREALLEINERLGFGWDSQDVDDNLKWCKNTLKRNPTEPEMFDKAQGTCDHCSHTIFNAEWTIDGVVQKETLFDIIRKPYFANPGNSLVAFHDNSSVIKGFPVKMAFTTKPWTSSEYAIVIVHANGTLTVETHNHPTGVEPYAGAATGTGGGMRDGVAVGTGGMLGIAGAGFFTGNLNLPGHRLPWEKRNQKYPLNLAVARDIMVRASDGACEYNNPVGEPVCYGSARATELPMPDGTRRAWFKPIMLTSRIGYVLDEHLYKSKPRKGWIIVSFGGPAFDIGFAGGSASSQVSGANKTKLDHRSVQRGDPAEAIKNHCAVAGCIALRNKNPIAVIHDQGAAGVANALQEAIGLAGGVVHAGRIKLGDKYLPFIVIWGAEYQERYVVILKPSGLEMFKKICDRESCSFEVLGKITGNGRIVVHNSIKDDNPTPIDLDLKPLLKRATPKKLSDNHVHMEFPPLILPHNASIRSCINRVMQTREGCSHEDLTVKGDRSVTGKVILQQHCGPANIPVADCAIMALSYFDKVGQAVSQGEQPYKLTLDPIRGIRMTASEAMLNLAGALITSRKDIGSSVNWMVAARYPGEAAAMFDICRELGICPPKSGKPERGKDSSSMNTIIDGEAVPGIRQVIITMRAMMRDVRKFVTPDIKRPGESLLLHMDLGLGNKRMGGSLLARCYNQWGNICPDVSAGLLANAFDAVQAMIRHNLILSYHDISDGGLFLSLLEMAFAANCGLRIDLKHSVPIPALFAEESGAALEIDPKKVDEVDRLFRKFRVPIARIAVPVTDDSVVVHNNTNGEYLFSDKMTDMRQTWRETTYQLMRIQKNPGSARQEKINVKTRPGISYVLPHGWDGKAQRKPRRTIRNPKAVIFRAVGTNSFPEMRDSFMQAGFDAVDVNMKDLMNGIVKNFNKFSALGFCGGFADFDVFGAGRGCAARILHEKTIFSIFWDFMKRDDTLSYWVCNGNQVVTSLGWLPYLPEDGRPVEGHPIYTYNTSRKFEARWSLVTTLPSPAVMLRRLEGCRLGVHSAHAEGRFHCRDKAMLARILKDGLAPLRFVDDHGKVTEKYPMNPNGSPLGITGMCDTSGHHFATMEHLERTTQFRQCQYIPEELKGLEFTPWLLGFENMRNFFR